VVCSQGCYDKQGHQNTVGEHSVFLTYCNDRAKTAHMTLVVYI